MMFCVARFKRAGFTLIEIMIVIAIIAILAGIAIPNIMRARFEAQLTACQENCKTCMTAVQTARIRCTWQQVANMLEDGVWSRGDGESCFGRCGDKLVEAGYLAKTLHCVAEGGLYCFGYDRSPDMEFSFSTDYTYANRVSVGTTRCYVDCWHRFCGDFSGSGLPYCYPCYEESLGACFY